MNSSYYFPHHCMTYRLSVGAGLLTDLFLLTINTHDSEGTRFTQSDVGLSLEIMREN